MGVPHKIIRYIFNGRPTVYIVGILFVNFVNQKVVEVVDILCLLFTEFV